MPNLNKLDETINQLEMQADDFKQHSKVLSKISELTGSLEKSFSEISTSNKNFATVKNELLELIQTLKTELVQLKKQEELRMDELIASSKKSVRDLDDSLTSKLDRFNSDIQLTIRNEGTQIQRAIELLFRESILNLEKIIAEKITKQQRIQLIAIIISTMIIIGSFFIMRLL